MQRSSSAFSHMHSTLVRLTLPRTALHDRTRVDALHYPPSPHTVNLHIMLSSFLVNQELGRNREPRNLATSRRVEGSTFVGLQATGDLGRPWSFLWTMSRSEGLTTTKTTPVVSVEHAIRQRREVTKSEKSKTNITGRSPLRGRSKNRIRRGHVLAPPQRTPLTKRKMLLRKATDRGLTRRPTPRWMTYGAT